MAIALRASGATTFSINSITPTMHGSQAVDDMMLFIAAGKPYNLGWSIADGTWTALGRGESGTTAAGVDTGSMAVQVWYKVATADPETSPQLAEGSPAFNIAGASIIHFSKAAGEVWETPVVVYGADETAGTAVSVTFASDPGVTTGDMIVGLIGANTDAHGPYTTNYTPAQTGVTFGAITEDQEVESTSGGDMSYHLVHVPVSSGTGSAAPTMTATATASPGADKVEAAFIRLRVSTPPPATTSNQNIFIVGL